MQNTFTQNTLLKPVTFHGIGVHSGAPARVKLCPAGSDSGIVFVRTDLPGKNNHIRADWRNVTKTRLCTLLENAEGHSVSTVEHIMAALHGTGIDNARIEIDGPEVPIMDGSAADFYKCIIQTGLKRQSAPRRVLKILRAVEFRDPSSGGFARLKPSRIPSYHAVIDFPGTLIGKQEYRIPLTGDNFATVADARTFGFRHEVEQLRQAGLGLGGTLDNAVVVDGYRTLNPQGLRGVDEFARHKVLDAIGDLYLAGGRIAGSFEGYKAGHAMHYSLLKALFQDPEAFEWVREDRVQTRPPAQPAIARGGRAAAAAYA